MSPVGPETSINSDKPKNCPVLLLYKNEEMPDINAVKIIMIPCIFISLFEKTIRKVPAVIPAVKNIIPVK